MNSGLIRRIACVMLAVCLLCVLSVTASAQPESGKAYTEGDGAVPEVGTGDMEGASVSLPEYDVYLEAQGGAEVYAADDIQLDGTDALSDGGLIEDTFEGRSGVALANAGGSISWVLPESVADGLYALKLTYASRMDDGSEYLIKVLVNGRELNRQVSLITLSKIWIQPENYKTLPERRFELDQFGNELASIQEELQGWQDAIFEDSEGKYTGALLFRLCAGDRLTLVCRRGGIAVDSLTLTSEPVLPDYSQVASDNRAAGHAELSGSAITVQAELPIYTSDSSLLSTSDHMSAATMPQDSMHTLQNTIGQTFWQYAGQTITWSFDVTRSGLYKIDLRYRQNYQRGVQVGRRIRIDGEVPFAELQKYVFAFSDSWRIEELGGEDGPYMFYLEEGEHTLSMEVVLAHPTLIRKMEAEMKELNAFYRQVLMIVGSDPDPYRDYMLDTAIPGFKDEMRELEGRLRSLLKELYAEGFEKGGSIVVAEEAADMLTGFIKKPDDVPMRLSAFSDSLAALGSWLAELSCQPLELDYIAFVPYGEEKLSSGSGFFRDVAYGFEVFLASFFADYSSISSTGGEKALNVWVNTGRDQAQVIKRLVMNRFIPEYDTPVNISLVLQGLIPATLSGKGPDIVIGLSSTDAVNLAVRSALVDLKGFEGGDGTASFDEVTGWFQPTSLDLYTYNDTVYALPVEEQFNMLFVRTDILEGLGLEIPETWDELNNTVSILARNYLEVGIPTNPGAGLTSSQSGAGAVNESVFQTLLFQLGGSYYEDGWAKTGFDSEAAISAFIRWTDYFTKYTLPTDYDLFSRFRSGQMPMAMVSYIFYNILSAGAPEIRGLWEMVPIPGTVKENGTLDRSVAGGSSAIAMFGKTADKERAWSFLQWYVSCDTQVSYSKQIESILGPSGRYDPANVEAIKRIGWDEDALDKILDQWGQMKMVPMTPVSYYLSRSITNAFRKVTYSYADPRETLNRYNREINKEIVRKRATLGLS